MRKKACTAQWGKEAQTRCNPPFSRSSAGNKASATLCMSAIWFTGMCTIQSQAKFAYERTKCAKPRLAFSPLLSRFPRLACAFSGRKQAKLAAAASVASPPGRPSNAARRLRIAGRRCACLLSRFACILD